MTDVVNVQFRGRGKNYFFDPNGTAPAEGQSVIVETSKGNEYGICVQGVHQVEDSTVVQPLRPVVRVATAEDETVFQANREKEKKAFDIAVEKIAANGLDMKLVDVEYSFEGSKILFFFTSDGRVDFRALVKDLASVFRTRIELRQIGVRDGAKMMGGLGICGRPFCCATFLEDFQPVSIKMAKAQSLSLNPTKISGTCGRLMCCLKYEQDAYEYLIKTSPREGSPVDTPSGKGIITDLNLLRRTVKVRLDNSSDATLVQFPLSRIGYTVNGEYVLPEPEPEPEPAESEWSVAEAPTAPAQNPEPKPAPRQRNDNRRQERPRDQQEQKNQQNRERPSRDGRQQPRQPREQRPPREQKPQNEQRPPREQKPQNEQRQPREQKPQNEQRQPREQRQRTHPDQRARQFRENAVAAESEKTAEAAKKRNRGYHRRGKGGGGKPKGPEDSGT